MREEIKREIVWRYKFIYENIQYIMGMFTTYKNILETKEFIINKRIPYELLNLTQIFLLDDGKALYSDFVKYVERRKLDIEYVDGIKKKQFSIQDKERLVWELFNSTCNLIAFQERNSNSKCDKLRAMDEYYKILNYENKENGQIQGSSLIANYLKSECSFGKQIFKRNNEASLRNSKFIKYISDKKNYNPDNLGILTEKEKQEIYLVFHEEIAWDTKVLCEVDKDTVYKPKKKHLLRQDINPPCGEEFYVIESKIFINPKDMCYDYYQSCPNCGYVVNIPHNILPNSVRDRIEDQCLKDEHNFTTMLLNAELRSIDYRDDVLIKRRKR